MFVSVDKISYLIAYNLILSLLCMYFIPDCVFIYGGFSCRLFCLEGTAEGEGNVSDQQRKLELVPNMFLTQKDLKLRQQSLSNHEDPHGRFQSSSLALWVINK